MSSSDHTVTVSDSLLELRLEQCKTLLVALAQLWRRAYFVVWNQKKVALKPRKLASKGLGDLFSDRVLFTTKRTSSWPVKSSLIPLLELTRHALSQQTTYYYLQQRFGLLLSLTKCFCLTTTKIVMIMLTVHATSLAKTETFAFEDTQ